MFKFASWISEPRSSDKFANAKLEIKMPNGVRPVVEIQTSNEQPKRKLSVSANVPGSISHVAPEDIKRRKLVATQDAQNATQSKPDAVNLVEQKKSAVSSRWIRSQVEHQFNLEILLKHKELQLIDQELAKCQVALEQLRRCHLIPYPSAQADAESMLRVTNGTGPAIKSTQHMPQWAPAYGIAEGPYSRHYAKWLIPDTSFDGIQAELYREPSRASKPVTEGRSTRYSITDTYSPYTKSRSQRGSHSQKFQALSQGYPVEKAKVGPCVLTRNDGQVVKLVCIDCNRENFSSTQGFINHCRIAHKREFKSHEEAATVSGQPYDGVVPVKPAPEDKVVTIQQPVPPLPSTNAFVHPLIKTAPVDRDAYKSLLSRIDSSIALFHEGKLPGVSSIPSSTTTTPVKRLVAVKSDKESTMVPSASTPRLSAWLDKANWTGNLATLVDDLTSKVEGADEDASDVSDSDDDHPSSPDGRKSGDDASHVVRLPARVNVSSSTNRPASSKGISPRPAHATPVVNTSIAQYERPARLYADMSDSADGNIDLEMMDGPSATDLSPHTMTSNNAPSLVSDDGEYDDGDDADSAASEGGDVDSVAEIDIEDDSVDKVLPRNVRPGSRGTNNMKKEDKHVTFMSPVKEGKEIVRRN